MGVGKHNSVLPDLGVAVYVHAGRIGHGDAAQHAAFTNALAHYCFGLGKLDTIIDAHRLVGVVGCDGLYTLSLHGGCLNEVGQQQFAVGSGCELLQILPKPRRAKAVEAAVDLADCQGVAVGMPFFNYRRYAAGVVA